jgi:hypothetical protein
MIFDLGLIPRINHVAGTTFEIRLSLPILKSQISNFKLYELWGLTRPAFAEVASDKFGFFPDFGIDKITKM